MISPCFMFVFLLLLCSAENCEYRNGWTEFQNHCYKFEDTKMTWFDAKRYCNKIGSYLVRIESWSENNWLKLQATAHDNHASLGYYTGATDANSEGKWVWESNGETMTIWDFNKKEPNGGRGENCFLIHTNGKDARPPYRYHDVGCSRKEKFICEKSHKS